MFPEANHPPCYDLFQPGDRQLLEIGITKRFSAVQLTVLLTHAGWNWDDQIADGAFKERVFALVDYLDRVGQLHYLVDLVDDARKNFATFATLRDRATPPLPPRSNGGAAPVAAPAPAAAPAAGVDPWRTVLLDTDQPFLDRTTFRTDCRLVAMAGSKPILSITGEPDTGKSYSVRYLASVSKFFRGGAGEFLTKEVRLDRLNGVVETGASPEVGGLRLAQRLARDIVGEGLPDYIVNTVGSEQDAAWAADAASWMISTATACPLRWIILDGFETTVLSSSAQALINSLLAAVAMDGKVRIALIGYPGNLAWCASKLRHVELDLAEFADPRQLTQHVINYLLDVREAAVERRRPPFSDQELHADVHDVLSRFDPASPDLSALEASLTEIAERVLVGA
jgi:hypothetical protein